MPSKTSKKAEKKAKNIKALGQKYVKQEHQEHIYKLPDSYIGSTEEDTVNTWIYNEDEKRMSQKNIQYIPGLFKIFDEIIYRNLGKKHINFVFKTFIYQAKLKLQDNKPRTTIPKSFFINILTQILTFYFTNI